MSDPEIAVGQWWSSPNGILDAVQIVRQAAGLDSAWVVTSRKGAARLTTDYILRNYWLMESEPASSR